MLLPAGLHSNSVITEVVSYNLSRYSTFCYSMFGCHVIRHRAVYVTDSALCVSKCVVFFCTGQGKTHYSDRGSLFIILMCVRASGKSQVRLSSCSSHSTCCVVIRSQTKALIFHLHCEVCQKSVCGKWWS